MSDAHSKLLIISSYGRPCGIAQYVEHLEVALPREAFEVEIVALPVELLRSGGRYAREASRKFFRELAAKVADADVVNLQFEPGLYGENPFTIWFRIRRIVRAAKRVIVTYHTVTVAASESLRFSLSYKGLYRLGASWVANFVFSRLIGLVRRNPAKFRHIVQTERELDALEHLGLPRQSIEHCPLGFLDARTRSELMGSRESARLRMRNVLGAHGQIIGCFGFLTPYKGIETAIRALVHLPDDTHLVIVGGLHPLGIEMGTVDQAYIGTLIKEVETPRQVSGVPPFNLLSRVHFLGALNNTEFNQTMQGCDVVVLPYAEVGQTSSGPAALALDMQIPTYCARNHCFRELNRYQPGILSFFEIGNYLELAQKIRLMDAEREECRNARREYGARYNVESRAAVYADAFAALVRT